MASSLKCAINNGCSLSNRKQFPNIALLLSAIIIVNLCPFQNSDFKPSIEDWVNGKQQLPGSYMADIQSRASSSVNGGKNHLSQIENCIKFIRLLFVAPDRSKSKTATFMQAEAKVLSKMAKMWYIKKKIKKLSKKLKKHTIAVPVFTAIPIYDHSYYHPQSHLAHVAAPIPMHHHHHAAAASSYAPIVLPQVAAAPAAVATQHSASNQQHMTSASNQQQHIAAAYQTPVHQRQQKPQQHRSAQPVQLLPAQAHHFHNPQVFLHPIPAANHIINAYVPSPPLFVDELGSLYGHYANAYGRYDGGYQFW